VATLVDSLRIKGEDLASDVLNLNLSRGESVWILIWSSGREPEASRSSYCDSGGIDKDFGASSLTSHHRSVRMKTDFWGLNLEVLQVGSPRIFSCLQISVSLCRQQIRLQTSALEEEQSLRGVLRRRNKELDRVGHTNQLFSFFLGRPVWAF